jgi:hypothetical protein
MANEKTPYDLEPDQPPGGITGAEAKDGPGRPSLNKEGLLEGFDEDADFSKDPELDRTVVGLPPRGSEPARPSSEPEAAADEQPLIATGGMTEAKIWAAVGAALAVTALVITGIYAQNKTFLSVLLALYNILLHAGTGLAAVAVAARLLDRRPGMLELAGARMLAAVAAYGVVYHLPIHFMSSGKLEEVVLGAMAYLAVVVAAFRIVGPPLVVIVGCHFGLWLVVQIGMELTWALAN